MGRGRENWPTLEEQISRKCVHFNGIMGPGLKDDSQTRCCRAGVRYVDVTNNAAKNVERLPCFREGESNPCDKRQFPTPEEVAAEIAEHDVRWDNLRIAIAAAKDAAKNHGIKKGSGGHGELDCPVCKTGKLRYSVATCNGHMHGRCETANCVSWME